MKINSMRKAIVALIMSIAFVLVHFDVIPAGYVSEERIELVISILTPLFVYLVPNKKE